MGDLALSSRPKAGWGTEYTENYGWDGSTASAHSRTKEASGLFDPRSAVERPMRSAGGAPGVMTDVEGATMPSVNPDGLELRDPSVFPSEIYPSVYRETVVHKDERGHYIDPFKNLVSKASGRRLMYDPSHPDKMYPSLPSSELADHSHCYSFPTTTGLEPQIPFQQDLQWQANAEVGQWPTEQWKQWTRQGICPTYDGHDDQVEYSKYKVHVA